MKKSGQVSIFVIIAIFIVVILIIFFLVKRNNDIDSSEKLFTSEISSIDSTLEGCLYENGVYSIWTIGLQGGRINLSEPYLKTNISYVSYGYYLGQKTLASKKQIEDETNVFLNALMQLCIIEEDFDSINITSGIPKVSTKIKTDSVDFNLKFSITLKKGERTYTINKDYSTEIPIRFGEVYDVAQEIIQKEIDDPNSIDLSYLTSLDYDINIIPYSQNTFIYVITDYKSKIKDIPYSFEFAVKTKK